VELVIAVELKSGDVCGGPAAWAARWAAQTAKPLGWALWLS